MTTALVQEPDSTDNERFLLIWQAAFGQPDDPHDAVDPKLREAAAEGVDEAQFAEGSEVLRERYSDRAESVRGVQTVSAFTFGGVVALFVAICGGMLAIAAFYKWMPLTLVPSLLLSGYSVVCFLFGVDSTDDQIHPTRTQDEYIEVLNEVKAGKGSRKVFDERANRSMHQRFRLWMNRVWVRRGIRGMQLAVAAIILEMIVFAVLVPIL